MGIMVAFSIPAKSFALERSFEEFPEMTVEVERLATHSREWVMPFVWVSGVDLDAFETALASDPTVTAFRSVEKRDGVGLYNLFWIEKIEEMIDNIVDQHGIVLEVEAQEARWFLKLRFVDRDQLAAFQNYFDDHDYSFTLEHVYHPSGLKQQQFDLTSEQREALLLAVKNGYFDVPRNSGMDDLAEQLGISSTAVSQRLRRGTAALVRNTLQFGSSQPE